MNLWSSYFVRILTYSELPTTIYLDAFWRFLNFDSSHTYIIKIYPIQTWNQSRGGKELFIIVTLFLCCIFCIQHHCCFDYNNKMFFFFEEKEKTLRRPYVSPEALYSSIMDSVWYLEIYTLYSLKGKNPNIGKYCF